MLNPQYKLMGILRAHAGAIGCIVLNPQYKLMCILWAHMGAVGCIGLIVH